MFVDKMLTPVIDPLIDYEHLIYFDLSDSGLESLYSQILYYLEHEEERLRIGLSGYNFVKNHHMSVNRIQQVVNRIQFQNSKIG